MFRTFQNCYFSAFLLVKPSCKSAWRSYFINIISYYQCYLLLSVCFSQVFAVSQSNFTSVKHTIHTIFLYFQSLPYVLVLIKQLKLTHLSSCFVNQPGRLAATVCLRRHSKEPRQTFTIWEASLRVQRYTNHGIATLVRVRTPHRVITIPMWFQHVHGDTPITYIPHIFTRNSTHLNCFTLKRQCYELTAFIDGVYSFGACDIYIFPLRNYIL